ncbi:MAG: hypothetical protein KGN36_18765 [Acidobacteriota bacterium]|nr:hypothetical protein [Acidobacteriota bacterium]
MAMTRGIFLLFSIALLAGAQDPVPQPKPVGVKITRPGVVGIAAMPPVGGTLVVFGYSLEEPPAGARLQGVSLFYEFTVHSHVSLFFTATEPLVRDGHAGRGDTAPGIKFRLTTEGRYLPLLAVSYAAKAPTATAGFGTGLYDHKLNLHADKNAGVVRWTGNFATLWYRQKDGSLTRQYTPSLAYLTRLNQRWGGTLQAYWTTAGKGYGGLVAAPFYQVNSGLNFFAGMMRNVGRPGSEYGVIAGLNYLHRPRA